MPYSISSKIVASAVKLSTLTNRPPTSPFDLTFNVSIPQPLPGISHLLPELGTRLVEQWPAISSDDSFLPLIHDLATMTRYTEAVYDWVFPYIEDDSYMEYINYRNLGIEHRLLSFQTVGVIDAACRIASLLYLNTVLARGWSNNAAIIQILVTRLRGVLEGEIIKWDGLEEVHLWVAFVGASCSHQSADGLFFTVAIRNAVVSLGLASCADAEMMLSRYLFVGRVHGNSLHRIWGTATHA
jgi:hypothetical protein